MACDHRSPSKRCLQRWLGVKARYGAEQFRLERDRRASMNFLMPPLLGGSVMYMLFCLGKVFTTL
jgi:hypothetical protein